MAAFDHAHNLYDVALKPRLLRSLINEYIPEEKQQLRNSLVLSHVVSGIKTHELLSERVVEADQNKKLIEKWKSAVDLWVDRVLRLVASNMPDKCWAGICLLGVTFEGCSSERFLASYSVWFQKLLSHLQPPADSHFVKVACCVSMSDLLTRLAAFPNMKRDGASHAAKLFQPVLKLMQEDSSDAEGAVGLLCTILNFYPSSVQKNYDSAEAAVVTLLMSGKCNTNLLKKLALCLSLLPKSRGDADSWSLMIQKVLLAINVLLNDSFQGLEDETKASEIMRALVPPGKDSPPPLGGLMIFDFSNKSTMPERVSLPSISALLLCCSIMLTTSYPAQAKVPVRQLLMLVERVLTVDGSLQQTLYPTITAMQQEYVCLELPVQHSYSLDIVCGIVKEANSQLLPHAALIIRIVAEYLRRCVLPELRIKLYALIKLMLLSMGVGLSLYLAEDVVNSVSIDLDSVGDGGGEARSGSESMQKKRKHEMPTTSLGNQPQPIYLPKNVVPVSVKIAALEALETLLTVGGASRSERWRSNVDLLIINVATEACNGGWAKSASDFNNPHNRSSSSSWADFQLASLRALLASLLSPGRIRPPYLAHGLELFRKGKHETGTKLAEFCAHALMTLEVLIHPRAIPLIDFGSSIEYSVNGMNNRFMDNNRYTSAKKYNPFSGGTSKTGPENPESEEDDLYEKWVKENDENEAPVIEQEKNETTPRSTEKLVSVEGLSYAAKIVPEDKGKGILVETQSVVLNKERESVEEANKQSENLRQSVDYHASVNLEADDLETKGKTPVSGSVGGTDLMAAAGDKDEPMDDFPDIVDMEPDTDEE